MKAKLLANPAVRQAYDAQAPESGRGTPSMRTVQRFASAVGTRAVVRREPLTAALARQDKAQLTSSLIVTCVPREIPWASNGLA